MSGSYGFAVVEINQASHQAERVVSDIEWALPDAEYTAQAFRGDLAASGSGRRERYVVVELFEVVDE